MHPVTGGGDLLGVRHDSIVRRPNQRPGLEDVPGVVVHAVAVVIEQVTRKGSPWKQLRRVLLGQVWHWKLLSEKWFRLSNPI
jgi:hypothetical protein